MATGKNVVSRWISPGIRSGNFRTWGVFNEGMVRKLERHREMMQARKFREGELWKLLVNFCQLHEKHGEMEISE